MMQISVAMAYRDIYDYYEQVEIANLLQDIPSENILEMISYLMIQIHTKEKDESLQFELLKHFCHNIPESDQKRVTNFINKKFPNGKSQGTLNFINNQSLLLFTQKALPNFNDLPPRDTFTPEEELKIFKAYLCATQEWVDQQPLPKKSIKTIDQVIDSILPIMLPYEELMEYKNFIPQAIKAYYFFGFCEKNETFNRYLSKFLIENKVENWKQYVAQVLSIYVGIYKQKHSAGGLTVKDEDKPVIDFLNNLAIDTTNYQPESDFKEIRNNPVYKINENKYLILNINFFIDKLFHSIQFNFAQTLIKHEEVYNGKKIKNFCHFKTIYSSEFSEKHMFNNLIDYLFENVHAIKKSGQEMSSAGMKAEPDYYIRQNNKIFVFEFKDVLLNAETKYSQDISKIKNEIEEKLFKNQNNSNKGIKQLIQIIKMIDQRALPTDVDKLQSNKFKIFPILVYTDPVFNCFGISHILRTMFHNEINHYTFSNNDNIMPPVSTCVDSLFSHQDLFHDKKLKFNSCINEYEDKINKTHKPFKQAMSFDTFLTDKARKNAQEPPRILGDIWNSINQNN